MAFGGVVCFVAGLDVVLWVEALVVVAGLAVVFGVVAFVDVGGAVQPRIFNPFVQQYSPFPPLVHYHEISYNSIIFIFVFMKSNIYSIISWMC